MDANYTFPRPPRPPAAIKTPSPPPPEHVESNRQSNALRASVLDAALQLGIGNNNAVAKWMFTGEDLEEDEEVRRGFWYCPVIERVYRIFNPLA